SECAYRLGLGPAVQQVPIESARVDPVDGLGLGAQRPGQPQPTLDDLCQLHRGGGDEPNGSSHVQVSLNQRAGTFPDTVGHALVVDLLAEFDEIVDVVPGQQGQRGVAGGVEVIGPFNAVDSEDRVPTLNPHQVSSGEQVACGQLTGEVVDRRTPHEGVVDVEESCSRPGGL